MNETDFQNRERAVVETLRAVMQRFNRGGLVTAPNFWAKLGGHITAGPEAEINISTAGLDFAIQKSGQVQSRWSVWESFSQPGDRELEILEVGITSAVEFLATAEWRNKGEKSIGNLKRIHDALDALL